MCGEEYMSDTIKALATNMVARKRSEVDPYILFLGAGAVISSGCSSMMQIVDDVLQSHDLTQYDNWQKEVAEAASLNAKYGGLLKQEIAKQKRDRFFKIWSKLDRDSQYSILRHHLWEDKSPSDGYLDLARLIQMGYIKIVLSTNLDNLLEKALNNLGWYPPENFIVIVNGKDKPEEVCDQLESSRVPFKLVKLHGTLESPRSYAFTPSEVFDFEKTIKSTLSRIISQSLLVIGHSMQDRDIDMLFDDEGKEIHFVNPTPQEIGSRIDTILKVRRQGSIIEGTDGVFDNFLQKLRSYIEEESEETRIQDSTPSIEGFLRSVGYEHELVVPRSRFRNLPSLYVKPTEYDGICTKLEKDHIVFIIGEPHLGKTYTAFYLLWVYYQKGYETLHIRHDRLVNLLHQHDGDMKKLLPDMFVSEKGAPRIIHFDDPFGETMERRTDAFAKELDTFLDLVREYEHLRVIVTTRLNIFRESVAEVHDRKKVEELEKDIRVHTSYRPDILLDILHRYTHFYNPVWASDEKIVTALDERLPDLLPAPHNIEFFVRTSEALNSLDEVLSHVEKSKEMVKALGEWMASLPDHEQLFLIWLEVCSTTGILFPDTPASKMKFESAYLETLAYIFKRKYIAGIPTSPFSRAKDKFDMILLESRDKDAKSVKYDFVHPSYHEAFWYAIIQRKLPLLRWWELLKENVGEILKDLENKVDLVQLRMIERYGTINRDLDQLLLLSAESDDVNEQLIALEHMLECPEQFANLPQFSNCLRSVISSKDSEHRSNFLNLVEKYFNQLPFDVLNALPSFLFDNEAAVRWNAEKIILKHFDTIPESIKQCETVRTWRLANDLFFPSQESPLDRKYDLGTAIEIELRGIRPMKELIDRFVKLPPVDIQQLFKTEFIPSLGTISMILNKSWNRLSSEQKVIIPITDLLISESNTVAKSAESLVMEHYEDFAHLAEKCPIIQELKCIQQTFNIPWEPDTSVISQFESMPIDDWTQISPSVLKTLINSSSLHLSEAMTLKILENYEKLSKEQKDVFIALKSSPNVVKALGERIGKSKYDFKNLSDSALIDLLSFSGYVQYEVLPGLLIRFERLSKEAKLVVNEFINNPPDWWVGGAIGQMTMKGLENELSKGVKDLPIRLSNHQDKRVVGALLAEMAQCHWDKKFGLQEICETTLYEISRDPEAVRYAEAWMDYELDVLGFYDKEYWSKVKTHLCNLSERD